MASIISARRKQRWPGSPPTITTRALRGRRWLSRRKLSSNACQTPVSANLGMFVPPIGLNLFATHALFGIPLAKLYRGVLPFIGIYLIALALITYIPAITLAPLRLWR